MIEFSPTAIKEGFVTNSNAVQLSILVSPTRIPCLVGARAMRSIFQKWNTSILQGHFAWIPMLPADNFKTALVQEALFQDKRITHYWDGERLLGQVVSQTMKLATPIAWEIFLLYPPGAKWRSETMSIPSFWIHQMNERSDLLLDPHRLMVEDEKLIN